MTPKTAPRKTPFLFLAALALLAMFAGCNSATAPDQRPTYGGATDGGDDDDDSGPYIGTGIGMQAPDFTLTDSNLQEHTLSDYRGQSVILYFWATFCPVCLDYNGIMQTWHETYGPDVIVLSMNLGDSDTVINAYMAQHGMTYPALMVLGNVQTQYHVYGVPHAYLLDAEGLVQFGGHPGYITEQMVMDLAAVEE